MMDTRDKRWWGWFKVMIVLTGAVLLVLPGWAGGEDLHLDGTQWVSLDIPHIYVILRTDPNGPALEVYDGWTGSYVLGVIDAYFDTGASGIVLSRESRDLFAEVTKEPNAQYVDVGVGGDQYFGVSNELYFSTSEYVYGEQPSEHEFSFMKGPWRMQLTIEEAGALQGPLDIFGVPLMAGQVVVFEPSIFDLEDLKYFTAGVYEPNDASIPAADFYVKCRMKNYLNRSHPGNTGPLPVLAYNPVIDDVTVTVDEISTSGTWLFDTGAQISMIGPEHAAKLGLTDPCGVPIVTPEFTLDVGGVGGTVQAPGYRFDEIRVQTLSGYDLVYDNACAIVVEIGTVDEKTGEPIILDGVFGSNLLDMTAQVSGGWPTNITDSPFEAIVLDTVQGTLGFKVQSFISLPPADPNGCGYGQGSWSLTDVNRNCVTEFTDVGVLAEHWLEGECGPLSWYCMRTDVNRDGVVDLRDLAMIRAHWRECTLGENCP